jgi:hypothetical protein
VHPAVSGVHRRGISETSPLAASVRASILEQCADGSREMGPPTGRPASLAV